MCILADVKELSTSARPVVVSLFLFLTTPFCSYHSIISTGSPQACQPEDQRKAAHRKLPISELLGKGLPAGLILFDLNQSRDKYPSDPRLALLDESGLQIYRVDDRALVQEFFLSHPKPQSWNELQNFPSTSKLFGVVLWGTEEYDHAFATVVCSVMGEFKVVFEGQDVGFTDLDFDGIPEILAEEYSSQDAEEPEHVTAWTWNGKEFVKVGRVRPSQLRSEGLIQAIRRSRQ
jgi:hypothetical protein